MSALPLLRRLVIVRVEDGATVANWAVGVRGRAVGLRLLGLGRPLGAALLAIALVVVLLLESLPETVRVQRTKLPGNAG